jgi:hypothetical protein
MIALIDHNFVVAVRRAKAAEAVILRVADNKKTESVRAQFAEKY